MDDSAPQPDDKVENEAADTAEPAAEATAPKSDTPEPAAEETAPQADTPEPSAETTAPESDTSAPDSNPEPPPDIPLPPATFDFLVLSLRSQAEMHLGLLHFGEEKDRPQANLPLARHTIDMMAMLLEKTKGNLSLDESRLLENSLTELRFRFVQASEGGGQ